MKINMDSVDIFDKYQDICRKFEKNAEDRLTLENERNEIHSHKAAAVREKWLQQLGRSPHGSPKNGLERKVAHESIQETIDLCHLHLQGLENDLERLEENRLLLLDELEDLKSQSKNDLSQIDNNNNSVETVIHITNTPNGKKLQAKKRRKRISSTYPYASPTRLERHYELQRKIDEELRKLQLADEMEDAKRFEEAPLTNGVEDEKHESFPDGRDQSIETPTCNVKADEKGNFCSSDAVEEFTVNYSTSLSAKGETKHQLHPGGDHDGDINEFHKEDSEIGENSPAADVVTTQDETSISAGCSNTEEAESDDFTRSYAMTSRTTTAGESTFECLTTEREAGDALSNHATPTDSPEQKDSVSNENVKLSDDIGKVEQAPHVDLPVEDKPTKSEESGEVAQGSSVDPVGIDSAVEDMSTQDNEASVDAQGQLLNFDDANADTRVDSKDMNTDTIPIPTTDEEAIKSEVPCQDDKSDSDNDTTERSSTERIQSTDEEYSGCDVDFGASPCHGVVDLPTDELPKQEIQQACDDQNKPIFVDVKYTVGEQITIQDTDLPEVDHPSPSDNPDMSAWDSSYQIVTHNEAQINTESFHSDKADSGSSRSSVSDDVSDVTKAVAEDTVSNAMKAAYEIYATGRSEPSTHSVSSITDAQETYVSHSSLDIITPGAGITKVTAIESSSPSCASNEGAENDSSNLLAMQDDIECTAAQDKHVEASLSAAIDDSLGEVADSALQHSAALSDISADKISDTGVSGNAGEVVFEESTKANETQTENSEAAPNMANGHEVTVSHTRTERIGYNPAFSPRNTEATKWFGQPTSENKIWMKPSGKVDTSAEMERRRLIKAMTRRHNPNLVPKWEPPKEKDFVEDLDEKHKESLKKYEERRKSRILNPTVDGGTEQTTQVTYEGSESPPVANELPRENIVVESVVHSRDAISVWESRLNEKQQKERLEKQRLSVGKQNSGRKRSTSEVVQPTENSATDTTPASNLILPSSEHIERESVDISKVRNRWKNMDATNKAKQPDPVIPKFKPGRKSTFTVNAAPAFRSSQSPAPAVHPPSNAHAVNAKQPKPVVRSLSHKKENPIDREIREAAEREEKWKQEQWEKTSEISTVSSEDVFSEASFKGNTMQDTTRGDVTVNGSSEQTTPVSPAAHQSHETVRVTSQPENQTKEADSESLSSYGSGSGNTASSATENSDKTTDATDSGIDEGQAPATLNLAMTTKQEFVTSPTINPYSAKSPEKEREEEAVFRKKRISSLTSAVTPRGWDPSKTRIGPVSPVSPVQRGVPRPEITAAVSPQALQPVKEICDVKSETVLNYAPTAGLSSPSYQTKSEPSVTLEPAVTMTTEKDVAPQEKDAPGPVEETRIHPQAAQPIINGPKKGGPVFVKKHGGLVGVSSSKSQLQTIMAREMEDAAAREAEWRKKQLELVSKGADLTPHPVAHSTREIRTPSVTVQPPVNTRDQEEDDILRRPVGSLFDRYDDDVAGTVGDVGDEVKKREVVKAMRVPKRKSLLAMRWEDGQFQNTAPEEQD